MSSTPSAEDLAAEIRVLASALHEYESGDEARREAMDQLRIAGELLASGDRRLRWYEQSGSTEPTKTRNRDLSPFSGSINSLAPPMVFEPGRTDDGAPALIGRVRLDRLREGPPHTVHGGMIAGLFDEILGAGQRLTGRMGGVTGRLTVRYRKPTPLDEELVLRSWVHDERKRRLVMRADCRVGSTLTAEANAVFVRVDFPEMERTMRSRRTERTDETRITDPLAALVSAGRRKAIDPDDDRPMIVFMCTGNAARSVMAAAMMRALSGDDSPYLVSSAGTHVIPGQPMSVRTRRALERHGISDPWHRSHQFDAADLARASLVVAMEPMHVEWMRRMHPEGSAITGSLVGLAHGLTDVGSLVEDGFVSRADFDARVASLALAGHRFEQWEEIVDPASGDQADFDRCSDVISDLVSRFHAALI